MKNTVLKYYKNYVKSNKWFSAFLSRLDMNIANAQKWQKLDNTFVY